MTGATKTAFLCPGSKIKVRNDTEDDSNFSSRDISNNNID